ncbi:MAG: hypothetical protein GXO18_07230 [Aquificae bacterium]|nr:hypothetical protein [Aquificota bacterium]
MKVKASKIDLKTIFEVAKTPQELERLLKQNYYVSNAQLKRADKLVNQRISLLKKLR